MMPLPAPTYSVIIPAHNAQDTVADAVRSALGQRNAWLEVIVIDDGSRDRTHEAALAAGAGDKRLTVLRQEQAGPSAARNAGARAAKGAAFAFLDADDRWDRDLLCAHFDIMQYSPGVGASFGRVQFFDEAMTQPGSTSPYRDRLSAAQVMGENPICTTSNLVILREAFHQAGPFDTTLMRAEDQEWLLRMLATTRWRAEGLDQVLVHYRTSAQGLSADLDGMLDGWRCMMAKAAGYAPALVEKHGAAAEALFERYLARRALRTSGDGWLAMAHLTAALRISPRTMALQEPVRTLLTAAGTLAALALPGAAMHAVLSR